MQESIVEIIEQLEATSYQKYHGAHKPRGNTWLYMILDLEKKIMKEVNLDRVTEEVLEELTADNFHAARHAAETVLRLRRLRKHVS